VGNCKPNKSSNTKLTNVKKALTVPLNTRRNRLFLGVWGTADSGDMSLLTSIIYASMTFATANVKIFTLEPFA
jgi:hypothetical protein